MKSSEFYFLVIGAILSFAIALPVALNNKKQGYFFWRTFMFGFASLLALTTVLFLYFYK